jgi:DNA-binding CsgD family transcriptional regulator
VGERLGTLAPDVIDVLRLVAVMPGAPAGRYFAAGADGAALDAAVTAGVLEQVPGQLRFAHPLLAAAVSRSTPPGRKRELHAAAAGVARLPEERARHRALAAAGPSLLVADEIAEAATAAAAHGAPASAAELFGLAASLTPGDDEPQAHRWRLQRARQLALAGAMTDAVSELERLVGSSPPGPERADALSQLGLLCEHDYPAAISLMERALAEAGDDPARTADIRISLTDMYSISGDQSKALATTRQALADAERCGDLILTCAALAQNFEHSFMHHAIADEQLLQRALELEPVAGSLALRTPPSYIAGLYHVCGGRLDLAEGSFRRLLARAEDEGVEYWRAHVLRHLAFVAGLRGQAHRAAEIAAEGLEVAEQLDFPHTICMLLYASAWAALQLGQAETVRELTERGLKLAEQTGDHIHAVLHKALPASLDLALGAPAAAAAQFRPLTGQLRAAGLRPTLPGIIADAAEALITVGELDAATAIMQELLPAALDPITPALLARCRAMLAAARADPDTAAAELGTALRLLEPMSPMPLERGRVLYALGGLQRRLKQRAAARATLTEALNIFDAIPAPLWAAQARAELARISGRSPGPLTLTVTERRVAVLVARGMTNREVAAELFVSVRAVEATLTKAYAKLGVRSRTELAAQLRHQE